ncbi:MAG: hypothetical protein HRT89_02480 [Lentisphaeria bacterium]|nr:hypothetical protein [Lentisphaeria bacterium]
MQTIMKASLFLCLSVVTWVGAAETYAVAGISIGMDYATIKKMTKKKQSLVGPGKAKITDEAWAMTYRYHTGLNKDRSISSVMLFFNPDKKLGSYEISIKRKSAYNKYLKKLEKSVYKKIDDTHFEYEIEEGNYKGCLITVECSEKKFGRKKYYVIKVEAKKVFTTRSP